MAPTMADVADRAGVSKSTVSLVLNGKPTVSRELREAVLKATAELGYRLPPRRSERRSTPTRSIVAVHYERYRADPFVASTILLNYVAGIQSFAQDHDVHLTFVTDHADDQDPIGYALLERGRLSVDGAILMGWSARRDGELLHMLIDRGIPVVVLSRDWPDLPISTVGQDHRQQACIALDHLIGLGHRQIAFLATEGDAQHEWYEWRRQCYEVKMQALRGQVDPELIVVDGDAGQAARALLRRRRDVTALFCITDPNAVSAIHALQEMGLGVPEDVSVIGLDGMRVEAEGCPPLTTVAWPHFEAGYLAAEALLKQIDNRHIHFSRVVVRSELVEGATCGPPLQRA